MDVSSPAQVKTPDHHEICCDACGYPRMGLTPEARCPECGEPPPRLVQTRARKLTRGRQAWLRCVAAGLVLLVVGYLNSLHVILLMSVGNLSAPAMNVPAPKIAASALLQRSIGGKPGELGVAGTLAVLASLVGVWLITSPRHARGTALPGDSLRFWLRWTAAITTGAALGLLLARNGIYIYSSSKSGLSCLAAVVAGCELPTAALLYAFLRQVAREVSDTRAARGLDLCAWLVPLGIAGALGLLVIDAANLSWGAARTSVYAGFAGVCVTAGLIAFGAIGRLTITVARAAFAAWLATGKRAVARLPLVIGSLITASGRAPGRWSVVAGILIWCATMPGLATEALWQGARHAAGGDHPYVNLLAPKIALAAVALGRMDTYYPYRTNRQGVMLALAQLAAVWMMTRCDERGSESRVVLACRFAARWLATFATAAAITASLLRAGRWGGGGIPVKPPVLQMFFVLLGELPVTMLVVWHLARVSARFGHDDCARRIRLVWLAVGTLIVLPLGFFAASAQGFIQYRSYGALIVGACLMAAEISVGLLALSALARLSWRLMTHAIRVSGDGETREWV